MKTKKFIIAASMLALLISGCKKYEDGPLISFRSARDRLWGVWEVEYFTINGEDKTQEYKDSCGLHFLFWYYSYPRLWFINDIHPTIQLEADYFGLTDKDRILKIDQSRYGSSDHYAFYKRPSYFSWQIKKLTNKKLWIESIYDKYGNPDKYYIEFKKIKDEDY